VDLDFDMEGRLIGLELLSASKQYSSSDIFNLSTGNVILSVVKGGERSSHLVLIFVGLQEYLKVKSWLWRFPF